MLMKFCAVVQVDSSKVLGRSNCFEINCVAKPFSPFLPSHHQDSLVDSCFCLHPRHTRSLNQSLKVSVRKNQLTVHMLIIVWERILWFKVSGERGIFIGEVVTGKGQGVNIRGGGFTNVRTRLYWVCTNITH